MMYKSQLKKQQKKLTLMTGFVVRVTYTTQLSVKSINSKIGRQAPTRELCAKVMSSNPVLKLIYLLACF